MTPNFILKLSLPTTFSGAVRACCGHFNLGNGAITGAEVCGAEHAIHSFIWRYTRYELDFFSRRRCSSSIYQEPLVGELRECVESECVVQLLGW